MGVRGRILGDVMSATGTTQADLSRMSGVRQPSISQFLGGKVELSDVQLNRLLACMGYELEVVRRPVKPRLTRSEHRSWLLHRGVSARLTAQTLGAWGATIEPNLVRLAHTLTGQPHKRNLARWASMIRASDVNGLHRVMTGLDRTAIEMREVSPFSGVLTDSERRAILARSA